MKRFSIFLLSGGVLVAIIMFMACSGATTYSDLLKTQKAAISKFITYDTIKVTNTRPSDDGWNSKLFYLSSTGLYFNLLQKGTYADAGDSIRVGDVVSVRYIQTSIDLPVDTVANSWTTVDTPYPTSVTYGVSGSEPSAWQEAISYMRYNGAEAQMIVPASLGTSTAQTNVTPYFYKIKILKLPR
jgi:hypothetical protein